MNALDVIVVLSLVSFTAWLGYEAYLLGKDLIRRHRWNKKHFHWRRGNERWMARWTE